MARTIPKEELQGKNGSRPGSPGPGTPPAPRSRSRSQISSSSSQSGRRIQKVGQKVAWSGVWLVLPPIMIFIHLLREAPNDVEEMKRDPTYGFLGDMIDRRNRRRSTGSISSSSCSSSVCS